MPYYLVTFYTSDQLRISWKTFGHLFSKYHWDQISLCKYILMISTH